MRDPGRELDALVAEQVMGFCQECVELSARSVRNDPEADRIIKEQCRYGSVAYVGDEGDYGDDGEKQWYCGLHDKKAWQEPAHYSTDIAAAWEVVAALAMERIAVQFFGPSVCRSNEALFNKTWSVHLEQTNDRPTTDRAWSAWNAETAPHAICLAALKARPTHPEGEK